MEDLGVIVEISSGSDDDSSSSSTSFAMEGLIAQEEVMEESGVIVDISLGSSSFTSFAVSRPCPRSKKKKKSITENGYYLIVKQSEGTDDEAVPCPRSKKQKVYDVNENVIELSDEDEEASPPPSKKSIDHPFNEAINILDSDDDDFEDNVEDDLNSKQDQMCCRRCKQPLDQLQRADASTKKRSTSLN